MINRFSIIFFSSCIFASIAQAEVLLNFSEKNCGKSSKKIEALDKESIEFLKRNKATAKLYELKATETLKEITENLLKHPNTTEKVKKSITENHHQYYVFSYPSDGFTVKAYISLPPDRTTSPIPLIILLRGGFNFLSLPHPGGLSVQNGYAVIMPTYRGGVSKGKDEFGGNDINDVKQLVDFLPELEQKFNIRFHPTKKYMVGVSRGGMQLFLALGRYPEIQNQFKKVAAISGLLHISQAVKDRSDFKDTLKYHFGFNENKNGKTWLANRDAINYVSKLSKDLSIMIAQGTKDPRVCLKEGYDMLQALHNTGHQVTYIEVEGGEHVLRNSPDFINVLMDWLERE